MMVLAQDLRESVLQAAMQGKLTDQLETDGSASDLLSFLFAKRKTMATNNVIPNDNRTTPINKNECPFEIPDNWIWEKIGNLFSVSTGMTPLKNNTEYYEGGTIPWITSSLTSNEYIYKTTTFVTQSALKHTTLKLYPKHTLVVAMYGQGKTRGQVSELMLPATINQACAALTNIIDSSVFIQYTKIFFKYNYNNIRKRAGGSAQPNLNLDKVKNTYIPIPPIEEQQRIVDRVNTLMSKIDEYEQIEKQLTVLKATFPSDLRNAILQAAMEGKLTKQLENDSVVEDAIKKSFLEKKELGIKKETKYPAITDNEIPYNIPESWKWTRLRYCVYNREQKTPDCPFSYIDIGSIDNIHQRLNESETIIDAKDAPSRARKIVKSGDVIYATVRPYLHNMCVIDREFSAEPIASTGFAAMVCHSCILNKFLLYYLQSPAFDKYANATDNAKGVAYPSINDKKLYAGLIPLPPIEEQQRIIKQLDILLPLCNEL